MDLKEVMIRLGEQRRLQRLTLKSVVDRGGFNNASAVRRLEQPDSNPTLRSVLRYARAIGVKLTVEVEKMKVLTFFNHAGGVSKTSGVRDVGFTLAELGFRVLLIDADPQASLTQGFWGPDAMRSLPRRSTIAALFDDGIPPEPGEVIRNTDFAGVDLVPGSEYLNSHNLPDPEDDPRQVVLRDLVEEVRELRTLGLGKRHKGRW